MNLVTKLAAIAAAAMLASCASVKPYLTCRVADGKAEVHQGISGIGVGQLLQDADRLCKGIAQ